MKGRVLPRQGRGRKRELGPIFLQNPGLSRTEIRSFAILAAVEGEATGLAAGRR
jgi:hypothetical protein